MHPPFSYTWFIDRFEEAKVDAEQFILSIDEAQFLQPPATNKWCIAESYSHLIKFGMLYYNNLDGKFFKTTFTENTGQTFAPRWLFKKVAGYFEPPYKIKIKTFNEMKPDPVSGYSRIELLDEFVNLQERFIALLEQCKDQKIDLGKSKVPHPIFPQLKLTPSECFAIIQAHQRRHKWQAEQTLKIISQRDTENSQSSTEK